MSLIIKAYRFQVLCQMALIFLLLGSCNREKREDIIFEDFESGFQHWDVQGTSFNKSTHVDSAEIKIENAHGKYVAYSNYSSPTEKYPHEGKLVSRKFVINRNYIVFSFAGGNHITRACVNLIINNKIVRVATGENDDVLRRVVWDVKDLMGKEAIIEVVDAQSHPIENSEILPYVMVDYFLFADAIDLNETIFEDFESGVYTNWTVTGEAFSTPGDRKNVYYPLSSNGFNGNYFAFSFSDTHDEKIGKLTSSLFTISKDYVKFLIGGGDIEGKTCMNLVISDSIVFSSTGGRDGQLRPVEWNVKHLKNKTAKIEIVDNHSGGWGHIMVDDIIFYNKKKWVQQPWFWVICLILILVLIPVIRYIKILSKENLKLDLSEENISRLEELKEFIQDSKAYVNSNYSISDVVETSGYSEKEIVFLFGKTSFSNIFNYINYLRVECFKQEITNPDNKNYTMISISEKCGFGSKTSFYRNFKIFTGKTPSEYIKEVKKQ